MVCVHQENDTKASRLGPAAWGWPQLGRLWFLFCTLSLLQSAAWGGLLLNEIFFNPPGGDSPNEYIELRGIPHEPVGQGTYLVSVEGDAGGNPGLLQNVFDLSGNVVGGNGFLVLLQKTNDYLGHSNSTILVNVGSGPGWGSGGSSSLGHRGRAGVTDLVNASVTFILIRATSAPQVDDDLDTDDDGVPDSPFYFGWEILDSIGVLDGDGAGDCAYGRVNFRRADSPGSTASALGTVIPVGFTPSVVVRNGNSAGSEVSAWVAGDTLGGSPPDWSLGSTANTWPEQLAGARLDHIGSPNFGAEPIPGVLVYSAVEPLKVSEQGEVDRYYMELNAPAAGPVTIRIRGGDQLEVSTDAGKSFGVERDLILSDTTAHAVMVRAVDDLVVDLSPRSRSVTHLMVSTEDPVHYALGTLVPEVVVSILDNDRILLNEVKVNPPGTNDAPFEFIELRCGPNAYLTNLYLLGINGSVENDPGSVALVVSLSGVGVGSSGLVAVIPEGSPYPIPSSSTVVWVPEFAKADGGLGNGALSLLLVTSDVPPKQGEDLDRGDNGVLEGLPKGALIHDAVGWSDGHKEDLVYGGVDLALESGAPDAATRLPGNIAPNSAAAWCAGELLGPNGDSLVYDSLSGSTNLRGGTLLTPGSLNVLPPAISPILPISGVIGDPFNPKVFFSVTREASPDFMIRVWVSSSNPGVLREEGMKLISHPNDNFELSFQPVGVGYSTITVHAYDGSVIGTRTFPYAASGAGNPDTVWYYGACDGSTALVIDENTMILGDDENQTLRIYQRHQSGLPLAEFDMTSFLDLPDIESGLPREVDVEASTRVGNRLYWLGSHSHAEIGETRTNRTRAWATDLVVEGPVASLRFVDYYEFLKLDLIEWDRQNMHGKGANYYGLEASDADGVPPKAPDGSGFSIEGLAMMPGDTNGAYIAFRAPIVPAADRHYALIVPVLNFASLLSTGGPPCSAAFGAPIDLELYDRGVRSLEGNQNGYLIVAGPARLASGAYPQDFRLYTWTGNPGDPPQLRSTDLTGANPEGIIELSTAPWTPESSVELLSDNGLTVYYGDQTPAKRLPYAGFKKCRSDPYPLGRIVPPPPAIYSVEYALGACKLTWRALKGKTYRLQGKDALVPGEWQDLLEPLVAEGPVMSATVSPLSRSQFYRVYLVGVNASSRN